MKKSKEKQRGSREVIEDGVVRKSKVVREIKKYMKKVKSSRSRNNKRKRNQVLIG